MDASKYDRQVELVDMSEAQALIIRSIMQEGALRFQEQCIEALLKSNMKDAVDIVKAVDFELERG